MKVSVPTSGSWLLLWSLAALTGGWACRPPQAGPAALAGTWRLASLASVRSSGEVVTGWMGHQPTGLLVYDPTGHVAVQIRRDPPAQMAATDPETAPAPERAEAFAGYYAYFGRYQVDSANGRLRHVIEASLWPTDGGMTYSHEFRLSGDSLTLLGEEYQSHGETRRSRHLWLRVR